MRIFNREPVLILAALAAVIDVAIAFGLDWTAEQTGLVNAAIAAVIGLIARQQVTPTRGDQ